MTRGKTADRNALRAHQRRLEPFEPARWNTVTYALRIAISEEACAKGLFFNLSNRHYMRNGKRGGLRRRYEPYFGQR